MQNSYVLLGNSQVEILVWKPTVQNKVFEVFFSTIKEISGYCMKLAHDHYITHRSQFATD
jgi:hypothetical protein